MEQRSFTLQSAEPRPSAAAVYYPLPAAAPPVNSATPCGEARLWLASVSVSVIGLGLGLGFRVRVRIRIRV